MQYEKKGNVFAGFIGALIGTAVGIVLWVLIGKLGYISSLVGLVGAFVAAKLYDAFGGRKGGAKTFILIICMLAMVVVGVGGTYFWQSMDLYNEELEECVVLFQQYYGYNETQARAEAEILMEDSYNGKFGYFKELMSQPENDGLMLKDLGMGVLFAALGCVGIISGDSKAKKKQAAAARQAAMNAQQAPAQPYAAQPVQNNNSSKSFYDSENSKY